MLEALDRMHQASYKTVELYSYYLYQYTINNGI